MHRKVVALVAAVVGFAACGPAWAGWPDDKPIEVVIGFAPGGGTDVMARKLLPFVEQRLGGKAKFVVLNKPGAGGEIAFAGIARAAPDAYSIGVVNVPGYNFIPMTRKTQYGMDEIRLIARVVDDPSVIVVPAESKFTTLADVLAALRSKPGSVTFGHNGAGTNGHLAIRMLANATKVEPNEISYRGTAAQRTDLLGGHLELGMVSLSEVPELHGTNKGPLRAIAILSKQRSPSLPDVPTAEETGIPVTMTAERGFAAPKAVSDEVAKSSRLQSRMACAIPNTSRARPATPPFLAFMPGAEWQKRLDDMSQALRPFAEEMRAQEQK
jgi:tripartite-type tricarboxylate transporter receptor subunit TctC